MSIECSSSVQSDPGDMLTAGDVADWVSSLPPAAQLSPILRDYGTQRDPVTVLAGIRAKWTEERP